jgi:peptidoglycan/LPS O-acetylase OafA/YrhL
MDRIKGFDGLRGLALIAVFLQHYTTLGRDLETGGYGVWLFFALSGFLIVRILRGEREQVEARQATTASALGRFFWRRTLRIMPTYYLALGLFTALGALHLVHDFDWRAAPYHYAYLSNLYFGFVAEAWTGRFGHLWSLAIEEQFYLLAAPLLLFSPSRWARPLCAATVAAAVGCDLLLRTGGASAMELYTHSLTNFGALAFGGSVGLGLPRRSGQGANSWPGLVALALIVGLLVGFQRVGLFPAGAATLVAAAPFWGATLLSGLALAGVYLNQASRLVRALEWAPLAYFGRVSYGFYLYHNLLPRRLVERVSHWAGYDWRVHELVEAAVAFVLALALAALSWALIERRLLWLKDRVPRLPSWSGLSAQQAQAEG